MANFEYHNSARISQNTVHHRHHLRCQKKNSKFSLTKRLTIESGEIVEKIQMLHLFLVFFYSIVSQLYRRSFFFFIISVIRTFLLYFCLNFCVSFHWSILQLYVIQTMSLIQVQRMSSSYLARFVRVPLLHPHWKNILVFAKKCTYKSVQHSIHFDNDVRAPA